MSDEGVRARFVDPDELGIPVPPDVNLPTVDEHTKPLNDDDTGECTTISQWGLSPNYLPYADNYCDNIATIAIDVENWLTLAIDGRQLTLTLANGAWWTMQFGSVQRSGGPGATQYRKSGGIIYPADAGYNVLLNETNTPNVVNAHYSLEWLRAEAIRERIQYGEIVLAFAKMMSAYGNQDAGSLFEEMKSWERSGG